jgi:hexosaminidase
LACILPFPAAVRPQPGYFTLGSGTAVAAGTDADHAAAAARRVLASLPWPDSPAEQPGGEITIDIGPDLPDEGYRLLIGQDRIRITAGGAAGAFYAAQTLRQLLPDEAWRSAPVPGPAWTIPCAEIEDAPALAWRGAHLDVARHFAPKRELLALVDSLAALKFNRFHLHLTDDQGWRIESRRYPALHEIGSHRPRTRISLNSEQPRVYEEIPHGGYYTLADLAEISSYAAQRMVTLVPEIEVPGHASALLAAMPQLGSGPAPDGGYEVSADWGIFPHLMSPLPQTREFLGEIFAELLDAVPAPYVHIGGDECVLDSWREDPAIDAYRRQLGFASADALHAGFLREIADMLADTSGVRAVVWDEGFASAAAGAALAGRAGLAGDAGAALAGRAGLAGGDAGPRGGLRPDTIVMAWRGMDIARRAALAGHEVIAAPVLPTYFDYYQADDDAEPVAIGGPVTVQDVAAMRLAGDGWTEQASARLIGAQFQVWTEYIRDSRSLEYMIFPRACALAEVAWAGGPSAWDQDETAGPGDDAAPGQDAPAGPAALLVRPALRGRVAAHLRRLDAAGIEYRPLDGPRPWQQGGDGPRRHRPGYRMRDVAAHLDQIAAVPGQE